MPEGNLLYESDVSCFDRPVRLEQYSPIKDSILLRLPHMLPPVPCAASSTSVLGTESHMRRVSNAAAGNEMYDSQTMVFVPSITTSVSSSFSGVNQSIGYGQVPSPLSSTNGSNNSVVAQQRLQQYAYQMLRNHRPTQEGPVWSPYVLTSPIMYTAPRITAATSFTAYPVSNMPAATAPAIPYPGFHANPDGTPINTTQGAFSIDESRAVLVRNINHRASLQELKAHFQLAGIIKQCDKAVSHKDVRKCTAKVTFCTAREAKEAVSRFNDTEFMGRRIMIDITKGDSTAERPRSISETSSTETSPLSSKRKGGVIIADGSEPPPLLEAVHSESSGKKGKRKEKR